ncbi:MAG: hypothetical protein SXQ77_11645, partial [Halobacteria archaeon]|nr:hypothetical protein [Halobacteria archaeon]
MTDALDSDDKVIEYEVIEAGDGYLDVFIHEKLESDLLKKTFDSNSKLLYDTPFRWVDDGTGLEVEIAGSTEALSEGIDNELPVEISVKTM